MSQSADKVHASLHSHSQCMLSSCSWLYDGKKWLRGRNQTGPNEVKMGGGRSKKRGKKFSLDDKDDISILLTQDINK